MEKVYSDASYADVVVPQTVGLSQADAQSLLQSKGLGYRVVGDGAVVTDQIPLRVSLFRARARWSSIWARKNPRSR